jgi:hypothetical protein
MRNTTANGESCGSGSIVPASSPKPGLVIARLWIETPTISCDPLSHFVDPECCFLPSHSISPLLAAGILSGSSCKPLPALRFSTTLARESPSRPIPADELLMTARSLQKAAFIIERLKVRGRSLLIKIERYEMSVINKVELKRDERSLFIFLTLFNITLAGLFLLACFYQR